MMCEVQVQYQQSLYYISHQCTYLPNNQILVLLPKQLPHPIKL